MPDYTPKWLPGEVISLTVGATPVVGGNVVILSGNSLVIPSTGVVSTAIGVAATDGAVGALVPVYTAPGSTHRLTASGAIAAGDLVTPAAAGAVATIGAGTFDKKIGKALEAISNATTGLVMWLP